MALCAHHPQSDLLPSPRFTLVTLYYLPHPFPSGNHLLLSVSVSCCYYCLVCSFVALQGPFKLETWWHPVWGCRGGFFSSTLAAHGWSGSDPGIGTQSVALKLERYCFSIVSDLIYQRWKAAFPLTALTPFFWREQGAGKSRRTGQAIGNMISSSALHTAHGTRCTRPDGKTRDDNTCPFPIISNQG